MILRPAIPILLLVSTLLHEANSHGCMNTPNQRGSLSAKCKFIFQTIDPEAPTDFQPHFPAGDRTPIGGSGRRSQISAAGPEGWTPFEPIKPGFRWRTGVCGDLKGGQQHHMLGGKFYHGGHITHTYAQGSVLEVGLSLVAHHNGFMELHVCDMAQCPRGEISETCFATRACRKLLRAPNPECESEGSMLCGPIDRAFPGRWYLPCSKFPLDDAALETFGPRTIQYALPDDLSCEHCVLHWYWASANYCNPPGVLDYFSGPDRPVAWEKSKCVGQAGAIGGVSVRKRPCGGSDFPEEYLQCADIRIVPQTPVIPLASLPPVSPVPSPSPSVVVTLALASPSLSPSPLPFASLSATPAPTVSASAMASESPSPKVSNQPRRFEKRIARGKAGEIVDLMLIGDGRRIVSLHERRKVDVSAYKKVSVEAVTTDRVRRVEFSVNGKRVGVDRQTPFFLKRNGPKGTPNAWRSFVPNKWMKISVEAGGEIDSVRVKFLRK